MHRSRHSVSRLNSGGKEINTKYHKMLCFRNYVFLHYRTKPYPVNLLANTRYNFVLGEGSFHGAGWCVFAGTAACLQVYICDAHEL